MSENCKPLLSELIADFNIIKRRCDYIAGLFYHSDIFHKRANNIRECGTFIGLCKNEDSPGYRVTSANFCRQRLCPMCQRRRALRTYSAMCRVADMAEKDGYSFLHLVLTLPNCSGDDLNSAIDKLYKCSSLLFRNNVDSHVKAALGNISELVDIRRRVSAAFCGVFRALEVTRKKGCLISDENAFHPHLHCLVAVRKSYFKSRSYIKFDDLRLLWGQMINVNSPQLYISKVTEKCSAIAEVAKYCVKPLGDDLEFETLAALQGALHGRRLTQSYGCIKSWFKALKIDLEAEEDFEDENVPEIILRYDGEHYGREAAIMLSGGGKNET